jgi:hypothetical protein
VAGMICQTPGPGRPPGGGVRRRERGAGGRGLHSSTVPAQRKPFLWEYALWHQSISDENGSGLCWKQTSVSPWLAVYAAEVADRLQDEAAGKLVAEGKLRAAVAARREAEREVWPGIYCAPCHPTHGRCCSPCHAAHCNSSCLVSYGIQYTSSWIQYGILP